MKQVYAAIACAAALALGGCGGGGGGGDNPAPDGAQGFWSGTADTNRDVAGIVLDDGTYWIIYTSENPSPSAAVLSIAGVIQGNGSASNGTFTSSNGKDFNFEGAGISNVSLNAAYEPKTTLNANLDYSNGTVVSFLSHYDAAYEQKPSLATLAGSYAGLSITEGGTEQATFTVGADGKINGSGASGCQFYGEAAPRATGNVYNVSVTFEGGVCSLGSTTVNGVAVFDAGSGALQASALNDARSNGFFVHATKS